MTSTPPIVSKPASSPEPPPPQARLLAIESSQRFLSVALSVDGREYIRALEENQLQAENLLPAIDECLRDGATALKDLDGGVFSRGPGSFTSIRIAMGFFVALRAIWKTPLYGISSLAALAWRAHCHTRCANVLVCLDARGGEIYAGAWRFDGKDIDCLLPDCLLDPEALPDSVRQTYSQALDGGDTVLVGSGWTRFEQTLFNCFGQERIARARCGAELFALRATASDLLALMHAERGREKVIGQGAAYLRSGL